MRKTVKNLRWYLYWRVTFLRDKAPHWLVGPLDWLRYEVLRDDNDDRYWYA